MQQTIDEKDITEMTCLGHDVLEIYLKKRKNIKLEKEQSDFLYIMIQETIQDLFNMENT